MQSFKALRLYNVSHKEHLCGAVQIADTPWLRMRGLLGRPQLEPGAGLLLLPSQAIHTFGMRYPVDVVLLDGRFRVLRVHESVPPRRMRFSASKTYCVLELRGGEARRIGLAPGDCLQFQQTDNSASGQPAAFTPILPDAASRSSRLSFGLKLFVAMLLCLQGGVCWLTRERSLSGQIDLRAYYTAGTLARTGPIGRIYDDVAEQRLQETIFHGDGWRTLHFLYPPFAVLPYVPLSLLSYHAAFFAVLAGNLGCLFLCAWLLVRQHPEWQLSARLLWIFFLCLFPSAVTLMQAQVSFVLLLTATLLYCFERRGQPLLAGLCLSVGLIKFQVMLPVVLLYLLWRRYRVVAGFALGSTGLLLLSVLLTGTAGLRAYAVRLHSLSASTLLDQQAAHLRYGMQVVCDPNLHGLATVLTGSGMGSALLTAGLSLLVLLWSIRQVPSAATAVTVALLLSYHLQVYGMVLLLLPLTVLLMGLKSPVQEHRQASTRARTAEWLLIGSFGLLSPPLTYWLLVRGITVWYVLASFATLTAAVLCASRQDSRLTMPLADCVVPLGAISMASS